MKGKGLPVATSFTEDQLASVAGQPSVSFTYVSDGAGGWTPGGATGGSVTPADNFANPSTALLTYSLGGLYNGGGFWNRWIGVNGQNDDEAISTASAAITAGFNYAYDGVLSWDRVRNSSATNMAAVTQPNAMKVAKPGEWTVTNTPAVGVQAVASKAAGGAGVRHIISGFSAGVRANGVAMNSPFGVAVRDGASGVGVLLWLEILTVDALVNQFSSDKMGRIGLSLLGSPNTAATVEFSAAVGNAAESVNMAGWSTTG